MRKRTCLRFQINSRTLTRASRLAAAVGNYRGGKSGQQRAPYFLTGRALTGDGQGTASATENKPPHSIMELASGVG